MRTPFLAVLLAWLAFPVRGDDPCAADAARQCPRATGAVEVAQCLQEHADALAPACRNALPLLVLAAEYGQDCKADAQRLCAGTPPGDGALARCLKDNESFVSASCQEAMNRVRLVRDALRASCAGDLGNFCPTVREGGGLTIACLRAHDKELSSSCRDALKKLP